MRARARGRVYEGQGVREGVCWPGWAGGPGQAAAAVLVALIF